MVQKIHIANYKSVQSLDIELGRLNVFIGANGCGKTNILEAIALGSAAAADKLDNEFLSSRGIRMTEANAMKSGFDNAFPDEPITITFSEMENPSVYFNINIKNGIYPKLYLVNDFIGDFLKENHQLVYSLFDKKKVFQKLGAEITGMPDFEIEEEGVEYIKNVVYKLVRELFQNDFIISNFLIFSPENYFLRRFEEESQIKPLGIRGEGLFSHLVDLIQKPEIFNKIKEHLQLIDWFDDFEMPKDLYFNQRKITIKDRFIAEGLQYFDQRSANEGFLYLLFYVTLFVSPYTPKFFAIDNIDNSLNPKLCSELTKMLAQLAKDHDKQAILTTHNPAILDGLNLNDDEQRLFVIYRNADGHTKAKRVFKKEMPNGMEPVKLSEQFLRGYIGGLNRNF